MRLLACLLSLVAHSAIAAEPFDLVIRNGRIVDGTGAPWYAADLGIREGRIASIGRLDGEAKLTLDAAGLIVAPGFIDMMGQTASPCLESPAAAMNLLTQGITSINAGEGISAAPLDAENAHTAGWSTMAEYFALIDKSGLPINCVQTVGHTQVRRTVLGDVDRRPSPEELARMKALVDEAMEAGAIGLSTALIYPPAVYASTEEIVELAKVSGRHGGGYYTHMRNEGDRLLEAIDEALAIGRAAGTRVHIFHLKAAGQQNWGKMPQAIARIAAARADGQQVAADVYPYINNGLGMAAFIHPKHAVRGPAALVKSLDDESLRTQIRREMETDFSYENWYRHIGFDWDRVVLGGFRNEPYAAHNGKSLAQIAAALMKDPWDVFFDAVRFNAFALPQSMSEANLIRAVRQEFISFCTDVGPAGGSRIASHPRANGAFPRILSRYVREQGVLSLEQAVSQMTSVAANEVFQFDRGRISPGLAADLVIFDPDRITDRATLAQPHLASEGVRHVLVNGQLVLRDGQYTGARPGRVLRRSTPRTGRHKGPARVERQAAEGDKISRVDKAEVKVFRERWNAGFREQVNIAFVMAPKGFVRPPEEFCHHVAVKFTDGSYFDGGNGVLSEAKLLALYSPGSRIEEMVEFDLNLLDRRVGGLDHDHYPDCPKYSDTLTVELIENHLARLASDRFLAGSATASRGK